MIIRKRADLKLIALLGAAFSAGCAFNNAEQAPAIPQGHASVIYEQGVPGRIENINLNLDATVVQVDRATRNVVLADEQGNQRTITISPTAAYFNEIKPGDKVSVVIEEELIMSVLDQPATPADLEDTVMLQTSQDDKGDSRTVAATKVAEVNAVVKAIDIKQRTATLQFADGSTRTVPVREDIALNDSYVGKQVMFHITEAVAVSLTPR